VGRFFQLTIDCSDPGTLVAFWQPLLGYDVPAPPPPHATWRDWYVSVGVPAEEITGDGADRLAPPDGHGVAIWFQVVPECKAVKNRLHLDIRVSRGRDVPRNERREEIERAVADVRARGGQLLRMDEDEQADHVFAVMADPEGNEFCLV
jgi:catechol 2,3-dioxygenase-like lactoylglutathione lyase family enzyme